MILVTVLLAALVVLSLVALAHDLTHDGYGSRHTSREGLGWSVSALPSRPYTSTLR